MRQPSQEEFEHLDGMTIELKRMETQRELALWELKLECEAPSFASINTEGKWVGPDSKPLAE